MLIEKTINRQKNARCNLIRVRNSCPKFPRKITSNRQINYIFYIFVLMAILVF